MKILVITVIFTLLFQINGAPTCPADYPSGYYCLTKTSFAWCFGQETPAIYGCGSPLSCLCGFSSNNPCGWSDSSIEACYGKAGDYLNESGSVSPPPEIETSEAENSEGIESAFSLGEPPEHLPYVLKFHNSTWRDELRATIALPKYDSRTLYRPAGADYQCAFHPPQRNDVNPTQMWIGRPTETTTISYTSGITSRLPDRYVGLFYAYAQDHYGLNPGMLIGLGAKESFFGVVYGQRDNSYFVVEDETEHFSESKR